MPLEMTFDQVEARAEDMLQLLRDLWFNTSDFVFIMNHSDWKTIGSPDKLANRPVHHYHTIEQGSLQALPEEQWRRRWKRRWREE